MKKDPVYECYSIARFFYKKKLTLISICIRALMRIIFACDIPYKTEIGYGTVFPHHALGIVIHPYAKIGKNCHINQNVTIGGRSGKEQLPIIGDNVLIGAGAKVLGPITIGNNVQIGAGAVVIESLPDNVIAAGVPAKIIKYKTV